MGSQDLKRIRGGLGSSPIGISHENKPAIWKGENHVARSLGDENDHHGQIYNVSVRPGMILQVHTLQVSSCRHASESSLRRLAFFFRG